MGERSARADRTRHETRRQGPQATQERASRDHANADRQDDGLELSQSDREAMLRNDAMQNLLPTPPKKPGTHFFYASMNSPQHVSWYRRMGYRPVRVDDPSMKGWIEDAMKTATGEYSGCVTINEMLLMEISDADYQKYMRIVHHERPLEEQGMVRNSLDSAKDSVARESGGLTEAREVGTGLQSMDRVVKTPARFEDSHTRVPSIKIPGSKPEPDFE